MKKRMLASLATVLAGAGFALAGEPIAPTTSACTGQCAPATTVSSCCPLPADDCSEQSRVWASGEYLLWWFKNSPEPVPLASTGTLGAEGGLVTFGGHDINTDEHSGARFTVGADLPGNDNVGAEVTYFFLGMKDHSASFAPPATYVLPFVDVTGAPTSIRFSDGVNDSARGTLTLSQYLQNWEANGLVNLAQGENFRLDLLGGFRYLDLHEDLQFRVDLDGVPTGPVPTFSGVGVDQFNTRNQFYGGNLGARLESTWGNWFIKATAKVALGDMNERLQVAGNSAFVNGGGQFITGSFPGQGLFAQRTNDGTHTRDKFAVIPEATINVGYNLTSWARAFMGYNFLYVSEVIRPGSQMSPVLNTSNVPSFGGTAGPLTGTAAPLPTSKSEDFWAQGINFGLEFHF